MRRTIGSAAAVGPPSAVAENDELRTLRVEVRRLRRAHEEAQTELAGLRESVAARDAFIATSGHELRNPMSALLLTVSEMAFVARRAPDAPPWLLGRLAMLDRNARRFVRRATTLLDVSRLTTGSLRLDREEVALDAIAREVGEDFAAEAARTGSRLDFDLEPSVVGSWDKAAIEQIVGNLVSNAIKYGAGRPVTVEIRADARVAHLRVRDRGIGIADEDRERIFHRFERAVARSHRAGFGIGLWIARQLVVAHGGEIGVESEPGCGSIFTATLPREIHEPHP